MSSPSLPRYVDEHEAVKILGFAVQTLRNWRSRCVGPAYVKVGRSIRYKVEDLIAFMERGRVERAG